jgi:hypothetical protein
LVIFKTSRTTEIPVHSFGEGVCVYIYILSVVGFLLSWFLFACFHSKPCEEALFLEVGSIAFIVDIPGQPPAPLNRSTRDFTTINSIKLQIPVDVRDQGL